MITKNEFFGAYLLNAAKSDAAKLSTALHFAGMAWDVIEKLQVTGLPARVGEFISGDRVRSELDSNIEFTVDDNAEEPKPGELKKVKGIDFHESYTIYDDGGRPVRITSNDGRLVGNPETIEEYNKDPSRWNELEGNFNKKED